MKMRLGQSVTFMLPYKSRTGRTVMIDYASKIKEYRERNFLTQEELADRLGVSKICIIRWEKGRFEPTMKTKKTLSRLFQQTGMKTFDD